MPAFNFSGYIISVLDERRICVRLDKDMIEHVSERLSMYLEKATISDTVVVNIRECRFAMDIDWKEVSDLIGVHVKINVVPRRYDYWKSKEIIDENNNQRIINVRYRGVSNIAKKISNS